MSNGGISNGEKDKVKGEIRAEVGLPAANLAEATVDGARVRPGSIRIDSKEDNLVVWFNEVPATLSVELPPNVGRAEPHDKHAFAVIRKGAPVGKHTYRVLSGGKECEGNSAPEIVIK